MINKTKKKKLKNKEKENKTPDIYFLIIRLHRNLFV